MEVFNKVAEKNHTMMEYQKYVFIVINNESDSAQSLHDYFGASMINCPQLFISEVVEGDMLKFHYREEITEAGVLNFIE